MEITSLKCNNCGANLDINPKIKFFTCTFCKSSLTIKKSGNVMFTEVLDEIKENTETLIDNSTQMLIEKKIARLDREWTINREKYRIQGNKGANFLPDESSNAFRNAGSIGGGIFIIFWIFGVSSMSSSFGGISLLFPLFGIGMLIFLVIKTVSDNEKTSDYQKAKSKYLRQRQNYLYELEQSKKDS